ncbi:hypothetical protein ACFL2P_01735 [Candidatus Moduliflexota bacterium]
MTETFRIEESGGIASVAFDLPWEKVNIPATLCVGGGQGGAMLLERA